VRHRLPLSVTVDATPLLGIRTGIGRYVEHLLNELAHRSDLVIGAMAFSLRGWGSLPSLLPQGVQRRGAPVPATALRRMWRRAPFPPVELLGTAPRVVHGPNFVLPPSWRAGRVVTVHDLAFLTHAHTLHPASADLQILVPKALAQAEIVTVTTGITADAIVDRYGFPRERIVLAPPGVESVWFDPATTAAAGEILPLRGDSGATQRSTDARGGASPTANRACRRSRLGARRCRWLGRRRG
jgi:hypothetical protein